MAKKVFLKDSNSNEILPITRGELVLDSSGKQALHSNEFLATDSQPGLMSKEDKIKINNMIATKVANKFTLKINSGTTEGTNLYSYDGASAKTLDIKPGTGIGFTTAAGVLTIANSGVRSITTGDNNGTIKVDTNGTSSNVAIKGLGSAAYTAATSYAVSKELATNADLNTITSPGFYNAGGGNSITNKPAGVEHFGLEVIHCASGSYYVQILFEESYSNLVWRRHCLNGVWSEWTKDVYTDTHYTTHLYIGAQSTNNNNNSNASTTNGNTYLKLFDNSTLRHQYNIKGTGNTTITSDASGNITVNSPTTLTWENITDKPTAFTPSYHTHATDTINALTGYTKATAVSELITTDSLNVALGKLEYKADLGKTAYNWYKSVTGTDNDDIINKWDEIVSFIDSVKETETDILDTFVTRKTSQVITGQKNFNTNTNDVPLIISRTGGTTEAVKIGVNDSQAIFEYTNDEKSNSYVFKLINTDTESSDGSGANDSSVTFTGSSAGSVVQATTLQGKLAYTYLSGSTTTKDQVIVSSGTVDDWTLKTLGSHAFDSTAYLPLSGGQMDSSAFIAWNSGSGGNDLADWAITGNGLKIISSTTTTSKAPTQYSTALHVKGRYGFQIASQGGDTANTFFIRNVHNATWNTLLHSNNYTSYTPILNSTSTHATNTSVIYAPSTVGTQGQLLTSSGTGAPTWINPIDVTVGSASNGVFYIEGTGSTEGTWLGSHTGITSYYKGLTIAYKIPVEGSLATTLNINDLGEKRIRRNNSQLTTHVPVNSVIILVYDGEYFKWADYDSNNYAYVRQYITDITNTEYPLLFRYDTAAPSSTYVTKYTRYDSAITVNPSTNTITATSFKGNLIGTAYDSNNLGGNAAQDYLLKYDLATQELTSNLTTITKSLKVTANWMDTGIEGDDLPDNGSYVIQVYSHSESTSMYYCYWTGLMSWYKDPTNDDESDEILLHRTGHAYGHTIYLRTLPSKTNGRLRLQIAADYNIPSDITYTFKFKRII